MKDNPNLCIEIVSNSWHMGGFGSTPIHTLTLKNRCELSYKDIGILISYSSKSGTPVDTGRYVIMDVLPASKTKTFRDINMGFMDSQSETASVIITSVKPL
jgi:hypothetical protein